MNVLKLSRSSIRVAENERDVKVVSQDQIRESDDWMMKQETAGPYHTGSDMSGRKC